MLGRKRRRARENDVSSLGNILVDLGYCTAGHIGQMLREQIESMPLIGQMLVERHIITSEQLEHALLRQQVLRGRDEPAKLKAYETNHRLKALSDMADRLQQTAESTSIIAEKLNR